MPKLHGIPLPTVVLNSEIGLSELEDKLTLQPMSPEAMVEAIVYLQRQMEIASELRPLVDVLRSRLMEVYEALPEDKRETRRTPVGMATYTDGGTKAELIDRDATVESLTPDQLRASYKPDMKALEVMLTKDAFERLVKRTPVPPRITVRDNRSSADYEELEF